MIALMMTQDEAGRVLFWLVLAYGLALTSCSVWASVRDEGGLATVLLLMSIPFWNVVGRVLFDRWFG